MSGAMVSALIVDDEPFARQRIRRLLALDAGVHVIGELGSVADLDSQELSVAPDLLLLDVQLANRSGFDLLKALASRGIHPLVIFISAYSEYAVGAFDVAAVDYILKPFDDERFSRAIARAKTMMEAVRLSGEALPARDSDDAGRAEPSPRLRDRLLVTENGKVLFVPTREIELIQSAGKFIKIFVHQRCYLVRQSLRLVEARLDPNQFVRVHRSTIINVEQIAELHPLFHGDYEVALRRGTRVTMSRRYRSRLRPFLPGAWPA
jgi:two-component system LytT family response regulator